MGQGCERAQGDGALTIRLKRLVIKRGEGLIKRPRRRVHHGFLAAF